MMGWSLIKDKCYIFSPTAKVQPKPYVIHSLQLFNIMEYDKPQKL